MRRDDFKEAFRRVDDYIVAWTDVKMLLRRFEEYMPAEALVFVEFVHPMTTNLIQVAVAKGESPTPVLQAISGLLNGRPGLDPNAYEGYKPETTIAVFEVVRSQDTDRRLTIMVTQRV